METIEKRLANSYPIRYEAFDSQKTLIYRDIKEYGLLGGEEIAIYQDENRSFYASLTSYQGKDLLLTVETEGKLLYCDRIGSISWGLHKMESLIKDFYNNMLLPNIFDNRFN